MVKQDIIKKAIVDLDHVTAAISRIADGLAEMPSSTFQDAKVVNYLVVTKAIRARCTGNRPLTKQDNDVTLIPVCPHC